MRAAYQDLLHALRVLRRSPRLAAAAIVILALGVAASTTAFAVVDAILAPRVPYRDASRLVQLMSTKTALTAWNAGWLDSLADLAQVQKAHSVFARTTYFYFRPDSHTTVTGPFGSQYTEIIEVPLDFFESIGVHPLLGRTPSASDSEASAPAKAVIGFSFWQTAFAGGKSAIGQEITIDHKLYTVVAVMPKSMGPRFDIFLPKPHPGLGTDPTLHNTFIWAWLRRGVSLREAQAALNVIAERVGTRYPEARGWKLIAVPYARLGVTGKQTTTLFFLLGAAVLVLLASCLNVGALLLGRGLARSHEIGILAALGAPPGRVARQLVLEGLVLGAAGGIFGLLAAGWFLKLVHPAVVLWLPTLEGLPFTLDLKICLFGVGAAAAAGGICGLIPALGLLRLNLSNTATGIGSLARTSSRHSHRLSLALVAVQVAAAMALLATSLLVVRSYQRLVHVNLGLQPDHTVQLSVFFSAPNYPSRPQQLAASSRVLLAFRSLPGVEAAAEEWSPVLEDASWDGRVAVDEGEGEKHGRLQTVQLRFVTREYFRVLGVKPILGRSFDPHSADAGSAVLVNQALVRKVLRTSQPLGLNLYGGNWKLGPLGAIVGVVPDMREREANTRAQPTVYIEFPNIPTRPTFLYTTYLIRPARGHSVAVGALERLIRKTEPEAPVIEAKTLQQDLADERAPLRLRSMSLLALAGLVILLGLAGVYATTRLWMKQRAFEFAVRAALGATPGDILRLSLRRNLGAALAGILCGAALAGILCGAALALAVGRVTAAFLFGVSPYDPATLAGSAIVLTASAALASYGAARKLARAEPSAALRSN